MKRTAVVITTALFLCAAVCGLPTGGCVVDATVPSAGGCPQPNHWNFSLASPLSRRWSTSLPMTGAVLTVAAWASDAQLAEVESAITDSFGAWSGVAGRTFNASEHPGLLAPLVRASAANSFSNDQESNVDGLNTICFNQQSMGCTGGVLAFMRVITANAPGVSVGSSSPAAYAGQILDSDTLFRPDGQVTFASLRH